MKGRKRKTEGGFTLIEVVVVIAVIAILAAILTPYITKYIDDSKIAKAKNETQVLGATVVNAYKDLGRWPNRQNAANDYTLLYTGTAAPPASLFGAAAGWDRSRQDTVDHHLVTNSRGYPATGELRWNGPYATTIPLDPWGRAYVINAANFTTATSPPTPVWVLSAGPNGVIDTTISNAAAWSTPAGDDIGYRIR